MCCPICDEHQMRVVLGIVRDSTGERNSNEEPNLLCRRCQPSDCGSENRNLDGGGGMNKPIC